MILAITVVFNTPAMASDPAIFTDDFEAAAINPFWSLRNQNTTTSLQNAVIHGGQQAVKFTTTTPGQKEAHLEHVFSRQHYGRISVWVHDPMQYIYFSMTAYNTETGQVAGIGVQDWDYSAYYSVNGKTSFPRSAGWHQFTLEFDKDGTRSLIDGQVVYSGGGGIHFNKVTLNMSGPGSTGTVYYDDFLFESYPPEIGLELPEGTPIANGDPWNGGVIVVGEPRTFPLVIRNTGIGILWDLAANIEGDDASSFALEIPPGASVNPGEQATFLLNAIPTTGGNKSASLRITSNDADENPYQIELSALALAADQDSDGDGMNDVGEYKLTALGFDRSNPQPAMVAAYFGAANSNGLFTASQMRAMHLDTPVLAKDPVTGIFTLSLGLQQSTDLLHFAPMPLAPSNVGVGGDGKLEIRFNQAGDAAFFRVAAE
jgi:hypothetical protein